MAKAAFDSKKAVFTIILNLHFRTEASKLLHLEHGFVRC